MTPRSPARRAVVVGAGAFGLAAARELAARGWRTTVVDPGPVPRPLASSTDRSKVVRMDYGSDRGLTRLAGRALEGWRRWNRDLFSRPLFHEVGFLLLAARPLAPGGFEYESVRTLSALGVEVDRLDAAAIARRFPAWSEGGWVDGYFNPAAGWVESGAAVERLAAVARQEGVHRMAGRVARLADSGSRAAGVMLDDGRRLDADAVVVAAGAWTPALLGSLRGLLSPVAMPVLHFAPVDPERFRPPRFPVFGADISRTGWYGFPAGPDGIVKVGHHGDGRPGDPERPPAVGPEWEARCRRFLTDALPALAGAPLVSSRSCFYCDARDGHFWIAPVPGMDGVSVASGGSGHGFKFAPVLGEVVADVVEGRPSPVAERFRWRPEARAAREDARFVESSSAPSP